MQQWAFLISKRWLGYLALLVVFCIVSVLLGFWQLDRREAVLQSNDRIINNWDSAPADIWQFEPELDRFDVEHTWQRVTVRGQYLSDEQLLARVRPYQGQPGFEILTPFELESGEILIINRGWLNKGFEQDYPDHVPDPPAGELEVMVRLKATEPLLTIRDAPEGQVASIYVAGILDDLDRAGYRELYGALVSESSPAETGTLPPRPQLTEGPHLSYSLQWFVFAAMAIIGYGYFAFQHFRQQHPDDAKTLAWNRRQQKRASKQYRDEDFEDEIVDALHEQQKQF